MNYLLYIIISLVVISLLVTLIFVYRHNKNKESGKDNKKIDDICSLDNLMDPSKCIGVDITPKDSKCPSDDTCPSDMTEHCALELIIGDKVHMTMAYICNCPKGKDAKKALLNEIFDYINRNWKGSRNIKIELGPMMSGWFSENSRCVVGELAELKKYIMNWFNNNEFCITIGVWGKTPHTQVLFDNNECRKVYDSVDIFDINNWRLE